MLTEDEYVALAQAELRKLIEVLDSLENDELDAELENDIITLELGDEKTYIINSHRAARQIWMAAERQAWHFDYDTETKQWLASKSGEELWATLRSVLSPQIGADSAAALTRRS